MIILLFNNFLLCSAFWCQTFEFEYFNGNIASCIECESDSECFSGRQCLENAWCKTNILCGDENDNECSLLPSPDYYIMEYYPSPSPPALQVSSPPILVQLHQYSSPPPPLPSSLSFPPLPLQSNDDIILKYFKEIGLPLIAVICLIGSMIGRNMVKYYTKSKRRKRAQIQLQNALDDDNLSDEASD